MQTHIIVVAGGVISGVGKGVITASLGKIVKEYGFKTTLVKIDPYINFDAGTLRPTEHGEVWVTDDGGEIDQDLGTYERFMNESLPKKNNITTGQIYKTIIDRERAGGYLGQTVQYIPHVIDAIKERIYQAITGYEFAIVELGGTVGDYENIPFLTALKSLERECGGHRIAYVLVTYLPVPGHIEEMKTKPTQQAIRLLGQEGILPDFIMCRSQHPLDYERRKKIEQFANIDADRIIAAPDLDTVYRMPLYLEEQHMGKHLLDHFNLQARKQPNWFSWQQRLMVTGMSKTPIKVALVGKYAGIGDYTVADSYLSIYQALMHASISVQSPIEIQLIDACQLTDEAQTARILSPFQGIIIPGGFGTSGVDGKLHAITYARTHKIPCLGLCYGMQLMVIEWTRNVCELQGAHTTEIDHNTAYPVIDLLPMQRALLAEDAIGGTMRLGLYSAHVKENSLLHRIYKKELIHERHRHRYEVNPLYVPMLEQYGLVISAFHERVDGTKLVEFIELPELLHPFFVATQAHPEFQSRFESVHPLFQAFIQATSEQAYKRVNPAILLEEKSNALTL